MIKLLLVIPSLILAFQSARTATLLNYYPGWYFTPITSNRFDFPIRDGGSFPAFIVETNAAPIDISTTFLRARFRVSSTDAGFTFGGQGTWNTGPTPPHARLFFSSKIGYDAEDICPECSWWSADGWAVISNGVSVITATLDPSRWTDSYGQQSPNNFRAALTNVIEAGLSFGGGSYYDIGVGLTAGSATFELISFEIVHGVKQLRIVPILE